MSTSRARYVGGPYREALTVEELERTLAETKLMNEKLAARRDEVAYRRALEKGYLYQKHPWSKSENGKKTDNESDFPESINIYDLGYDPARWNSYVDWMAGAPPIHSTPKPGPSPNWPTPYKSRPSPKSQPKTHAY